MTKGGRHRWTPEETALVVRGIREKLTPSQIKSTYLPKVETRSIASKKAGLKRELHLKGNKSIKLEKENDAAVGNSGTVLNNCI